MYVIIIIIIITIIYHYLQGKLIISGNYRFFLNFVCVDISYTLETL